MRENGLTVALNSGRPAVMGWLSSGSPYLAEVVSHAGYDSVVVDLQHSMFGIDTAITLLQTISTGPATPGVRCPDLNAATIGKLLDAGAYVVICPSIDTPEQARQLVRMCRYPPAGVRSFGPSRGLLYGGPDYFEHADETIEVWAMIESSEGLSNVAAIAATPGINGLYIGPNDLALALGGQPGAPSQVFDDAVKTILGAAHEAGIRAGIFAQAPDFAASMIELGFDLVTPGSDVTQIKDVARERLTRLKGL
jgi:4-hydroxy-2-oxoheptanedioate aldolase